MSLNHPLISVIMPAYNSQQFLEEAIESVLHQTYRHFELFIMDDNSSDETVSIAKKFEDKRVSVFLSNHNKGQSFQLNKGIAIAEGDYISIMHADDVMLPDKLEKQLFFFQNRPLTDICGCFVQLIGEESAIWTYPEKDRGCKDILLTSVPFAHPAVMIRKGILKNIDPVYTPGMAAAEDYDLWVRLADKAIFGNVQKVLLKYRVHAAQLSVIKKREEEKIVDRIRMKIISGLFKIQNENDVVNCFNTVYYAEQLNIQDYINSLKILWNAGKKQTVFSTTVLRGRLKHSIFRKLFKLSFVKKIKLFYNYPFLLEIIQFKTMIRILGSVA